MVERLTILQAGGPETIHNLDNLSKSYATQLIEVISNADKLVWVDYQGKNTECIIEVMQSIVNVHGLTLEDIAHAGQRSKHETYQTYDFITIRDVVIEYKEWSKKIHNNQVSIVFNDKYVFSFHTHESPSIDKVIERTKIAGCKASEKAGDFLTYSIIDSIVDGYFDAIDTLEDVADKADDVVSSINGEHNHNVLKDIHWLRRTAITLRKSVRPMRDVCNSMSSQESKFITKDLGIYIRDLYDHATRVVESIDTLRDAAYSMSEMHMSNNSMRMNNTMKVLTIITTVFTPVMFLASIYGMNFDWIPEIHVKGGYYIFWIIAIGLTTIQLYYFRKKKWL